LKSVVVFRKTSGGVSIFQWQMDRQNSNKLYTVCLCMIIIFIFVMWT